MTKRQRFDKATTTVANNKQRALLNVSKHRDIATKKIPQIVQLEQAMHSSTIKLSKLILSKATSSTEIIPKIMQENINAQRKIKELLTDNGYPEDFLEPQFSCRRCSDSGYVDGKKCECLQTIIRNLSVEEFNSSTSMSLSKFSDFKLSYYSDKTVGNNGRCDYSTMSRILRFCTDYASTFSPKSPNILMLGNTGLGKTHLSLSIANVSIESGYSVLYGTAQEFFQKIQNEFFGKNKNGENTSEMILEADLFILDDLGAEYESNFNVSTFYNIVNSRLNHNKPTIVNTNLSLKEIEKRYSTRVASRLMTLYSCLKFVGTDIRQIKLRE